MREAHVCIVGVKGNVHTHPHPLCTNSKDVNSPIEIIPNINIKELPILILINAKVVERDLNYVHENQVSYVKSSYITYKNCLKIRTYML